MKIIDLLNKIANGEEVPREFTYKGYLWEYDVKNKMWFYYFGESKNHRFDRLFYLNMILNDEVEILEEEKKIPEKLPYYSMEKIQKAKNKDEWREERIILLEKRVDDLHNKMNELLDYIKSKGD